MDVARRVFLTAPLAAAGLAAAGPEQAEVAADFTGLSFETAELVRGSLLTPGNASLIALIRRLGRLGVIRIGGNTSDRAAGHPTEAAIIALGGVLRATGWSLIYGLDLGNGSAERAAREAEMVTRAAGPALMALQIGNEPDLFDRSIRPASWGFRDYLAAWERFARAVLERMPEARFAGPDIASRGGWIMPFAMDARPRPVLLTRHFYAEGPGSSPEVTIARLLGSGPALDAALDPAEQASRQSSLPLRMAETNSVYDGGRPGVSDTLAAAAWGAELMFRLAARGWAGVNFHDRPTRSYAPIGRASPLAKPLYYGMLMFAAARARRVALLPGTADVRLYHIAGRDGRMRIACFNRDPRRAARAILPAGAKAASVLRLAAATPATAMVTLGGARVADDGTWKPHLEIARAPIELAPASGAIVELA